MSGQPHAAVALPTWVDPWVSGPRSPSGLFGVEKSVSLIRNRTTIPQWSRPRSHVTVRTAAVPFLKIGLV